MGNLTGIIQAIGGGAFDSDFLSLNPGRESLQRDRYAEAVRSFADLFGEDREISLFSAPGRSEIGGNHTDHQRGCVIAAAINLDIICVASKNQDGIIRVNSKGHKAASVNLSDLSRKDGEADHSVSIVRGIAYRCRELGYEVGGFDAYTTSDVPRGSGLSSSAAFETAVSVIISHLFNGGEISPAQIAKIGKYAENAYYGKPCGLMDQMASSMGGLITIDFKDVENPEATPVNFDFSSCGHSLCIVDTKGDHSGLTGEYAAIPAEMGAVAAYFGKPVLREVDESAFYSSIPRLRESCGDRAVLRAMHFFSETKRPGILARALENGDFETFKRIIIESGESSFACLQNAFVRSDPESQGVPLALAESKRILNGKGAWRIHGGGFAGTIQAFVPDSLLGSYLLRMESVFGAGSCHALQIRGPGGTPVKGAPGGA